MLRPFFCWEGFGSWNRISTFDFEFAGNLLMILHWQRNFLARSPMQAGGTCRRLARDEALCPPVFSMER